MARKAANPGGGKKKRRRRKMRLTLKSRGLKKDQGYTDKVGWSLQNKTPPKTQAPSNLRLSATSAQCAVQ